MGKKIAIISVLIAVLGLGMTIVWLRNDNRNTGKIPAALSNTPSQNSPFQTDSIQLQASLIAPTPANNQMLKISAMVFSKQPIREVTAQLVETGNTLPLYQASGDTQDGLWEVTWQTTDLSPGTYFVRITATDNQGNSTTSHPISFLQTLPVTK